MKILMLTPYLPYPPASGGQIRTLNLLKYLSRNHEVTLVSLYKTAKEKEYASYLASYCKEVFICKRAEKPWQPGILLRAIFTPKPLLIVRNFSSEAEQLLKVLMEKKRFDVIHAETFYIMPHLSKTGIPVLLVEQTIEYQVYQHFVDNLPWLAKPMFALDVFKLKIWEKFYWKKATVVATVSESDQKVIRRDEPGIRPIMVPNGAGDEMFTDRITPKTSVKPVFLFQGNFSWLQNREAAGYLIERIFPLLKKQIPECRLVIAGQETDKIQAKEDSRLEIIEIKPKDSRKVKEVYESSGLFIAPIYGPGGTRLKILAAMASGLPVVSSRTGVEGLDVKNGVHAMVADNPQQFVDQSVKILRNISLYNNVRKQAYELVKTKYSWSSIAGSLEKVYLSMTAPKTK